MPRSFNRLFKQCNAIMKSEHTCAVAFTLKMSEFELEKKKGGSICCSFGERVVQLVYVAYPVTTHEKPQVRFVFRLLLRLLCPSAEPSPGGTVNTILCLEEQKVGRVCTDP